MEKEAELSFDKVYNLPKFSIIKHNALFIAIIPEYAKWIILENENQVEILKRICSGEQIGSIFNDNKESQDDVIMVLTQIEAKQIEKSSPKSIFSNTRLHLHLTNKCNLKCPHCYMYSGNSMNDELKTAEIKKLFNSFKSFGGTDVSFTGGEPTMRKDFFELLEFADSIGLRVALYTNGCLWNDEMVKRFSKLNNDGVQISIDGFDDASNAVTRGKGSFEKSLHAVDLFIKNNVKVKIATTAPYELLKNNVSKYVNFSKKLIEEYGDEYLTINYSYFFMPGRNLDQKQIDIQKEDYFNIVSKVVKNIYPDIDEDGFVINLIDDQINDNCGFGSLNVKANGDFYFCDRIPDVNKIGNVREMDFDKVFDLMKKAENAGKIDNFKPCNKCELRYICGGGCRVENFKDFSKLTSFDNVDFDKIKPRECTEKEKILDLMITTNERFFL